MTNETQIPDKEIEKFRRNLSDEKRKDDAWSDEEALRNDLGQIDYEHPE